MCLIFNATRRHAGIYLGLTSPFRGIVRILCENVCNVNIGVASMAPDFKQCAMVGVQRYKVD